jgi:hypothetical protein
MAGHALRQRRKLWIVGIRRIDLMHIEVKAGAGYRVVEPPAITRRSRNWTLSSNHACMQVSIFPTANGTKEQPCATAAHPPRPIGKIRPVTQQPQAKVSLLNSQRQTGRFLQFGRRRDTSHVAAISDIDPGETGHGLHGGMTGPPAANRRSKGGHGRGQHRTAGRQIGGAFCRRTSVSDKNISVWEIS